MSCLDFTILTPSLGQYCWWHRYQIAAPYYGAYFASQALAGISSIAQLDDGSSSFGAYALYTQNSSAPARALLFNSEFHGSNTTQVRSSEAFTLYNLGSFTSAKAVRLTALYADKGVTDGQVPSISGLTFEDGTCAKQGAEKQESFQVEAGSLTVSLSASEALLLYFA